MLLAAAANTVVAQDKGDDEKTDDAENMEVIESRQINDLQDTLSQDSLASREDDAFVPFFSLTKLREAVIEGNSQRLTDLLFGLEHAERVFSRTHDSGVKSDSLALYVMRFNKLAGAADQNKRIVAYASQHGKEIWTELVSTARSTAAAEELKKSVESSNDEMGDMVNASGSPTPTAVLLSEAALGLPLSTSRSNDDPSTEKEKPEISLDDKVEPTFNLIEEFLTKSRRNKPGDRRRRSVCHLRMRCGNTDSDSGEAVYQPDPGWVIVDYKVVVESAFGQRHYEDYYVQARSRLTSTNFISSRYNEALRGAYQKGMTRYAADIKYERDRAINRVRQLASSHRALGLFGSIAGEGVFRGGASLKARIDIVEEFIGDQRYYADRGAYWARRVANASPPRPTPPPQPQQARVVVIHNRTNLNLGFDVQQPGAGWQSYRLNPGDWRWFSQRGNPLIRFDDDLVGDHWTQFYADTLPFGGPGQPQFQHGSLYQFEQQGNRVVLRRVR